MPSQPVGVSTTKCKEGSNGARLLQTICPLTVLSHHSRQEALDGIGEKRIPYPRPR
jgi:hypothetical protein